MSTFQCVNRSNSHYGNKSLVKTEILPSCCMSSIELFGSLNCSSERPNNTEIPDWAALKNKREQRLRRAIKAEMLSL